MKYIKMNTSHNVPRGIRTEWTDIPEKKSKKIYLDEVGLKKYLDKIKTQECDCEGMFSVDSAKQKCIDIACNRDALCFPHRVLSNHFIRILFTIKNIRMLKESQKKLHPEQK